MTIIDLTPALAAQCAIPPSCVESLCASLMRIVSDGQMALGTNPLAMSTTKSELKICRSCIPIQEKLPNAFNGDAWEKKLHPSQPSPSVDIGMLVGSEQSPVVIPVEGKLGIACEYPGDRAGGAVRLVGLEAKVAGLRSLLPSGVSMSPVLIVVVPKNGQEWAWHSIRRWNLAGNKIGKLFSCCIDDFLKLIGRQTSLRTPTCVSVMNSFRSRRLLEEFKKPGPMSQVQLPKGGHCTACRKCRDACPRTAIAIVPDAHGRLHPFVDKKSCISGCRHCESVCPILNPQGDE